MEKQKILIVDDSEINRALLADILESKYEIEEAENGREALQILEQRKDEFSLLLLDIMMPEMDGFDVLKAINQAHWNNDFAVMMISANDSPKTIASAYSLGAFDYIGRPFDPTIVRHRIANTMLLYARQQYLENIVMEQFSEREKNNSLMTTVLSHIVEFRNGECGRHVLNIKVITKLLLEELSRNYPDYRMSAHEISLIVTASALHDIGKIAIPDHILNKPGKLTPEEFQVMQSHSLTGAKLLMDLPDGLSSAPLIQIAYEICRWHHERYDGSGYPDGLIGNEIPMTAQVVSIADVYDALTSERCYKEAYSHKKAMDMILHGKCGAFSPILLTCLENISRDLQGEYLWESKTVTDSIEFQKWKVIDYNQLSVPSHREERMEVTLNNLCYHRLLYTDSLTNVYNRRYYDESFNKGEGIQAIAMIDVDNFKQINDQYGHETGDDVLREVAQTIVSSVRQYDSVIRYGGDEFVIIFEQIPSRIFQTRLEEIRSSIQTISLHEYPELKVSVSVGGVYGAGTIKDLLKKADKLMYISKKMKNKVSIDFLDESIE